MSNQPVTTVSNRQPVRARDRVAGVVRFSPRQIRSTVSEVEGFNAKFAVIVTSGVGTMACAYLFAAIALISLPKILIESNVLKAHDVPAFFNKPGLILIVAWIAQTFLQLVLLSIILVGQRVQSAASDARGVKEFQDTEVILDRLDTRTTGGLTEVLEAIRALEKKAVPSS
jgi:hypothetical protein